MVARAALVAPPPPRCWLYAWRTRIGLLIRRRSRRRLPAQPPRRLPRQLTRQLTREAGDEPWIAREVSHPQPPRFLHQSEAPLETAALDPLRRGPRPAAEKIKQTSDADHRH